MKTTEDTYDLKYKNGYGVMYPDGHVIRIYEHFLKNKMETKQNKKLFDFGCGNGTHALYFETKGFKTYGVDISEKAIEICKDRINDTGTNFKVIEPGENFEKYFNTKFDVIFSNQTLYYLDDCDLKNTLEKMYDMLNDDGVVIFTMMGVENYYYNLSEKCSNNNLRKVELKGRLNETTYINFVKNEEEMLDKFRLFKPMKVGYYDFLTNEGPSFHYYFVGTK